jgi:hypothetical protein
VLRDNALHLGFCSQLSGKAASLRGTSLDLKTGSQYNAHTPVLMPAESFFRRGTSSGYLILTYLSDFAYLLDDQYGDTTLHGHFFYSFVQCIPEKALRE